MLLNVSEGGEVVEQDVKMEWKYSFNRQGFSMSSLAHVSSSIKFFGKPLFRNIHIDMLESVTCR